MIILLPNTSSQTISIMPRKDLSTFSSVNLKIRRDGDGKSENITSATIAANGNFTDVTFSSTILKEGSTYFLEITGDTELVYRDKIFSTSQSDYKIKHVVSQNLYTTYSSADDNTYIV